MQKIVPHLWFDTQAKEAAAFYAAVFPESKVNSVNVLKNTPSGDCDIVNFTLWGMEFMSISAGPMFKFNPSISFIVNFDPLFFNKSEQEARKQLDTMWEKLSKGGNALMEIGEYPFSKRYGWIQDKYGVSWQLMLTDPSGAPRPAIIPTLLFVGDNVGRAEEAINFYQSVFKDSEAGPIHRYGPNQAPDKEGTVMFADFRLEERWFAAMDSAHKHDFQFNEAISLLINVKDQKEIDYYWEKLSADPKAEMCGWLKDKFGVSWQVNPVALDKMLTDTNEKRVANVTRAFLKMKKFDLATLERAYEEAK
jgi:predicted 3-demethylubiquinone-9 3-methyltransferase (glyoxalase superfamily)